MKKILALLLACLLVLTPIIPAVAADTQTLSATTANEYTVISGGNAKCKIVRSVSADSSLARMTADLRKTIAEVTGVSLSLSTDVLRNGTEPDANAREILFGSTNRPESEKVLADAPYGGFVIAQIGNKLVINAPNSYGLSAALEKFVELLDEYAEEGEFSLPAGFSFVGDITYAGTPMADLPRYPAGRIEGILDVGDDATMMIVGKTSLEEHGQYCRILAENGYRLHAENTVAGNRFSTYVNDTHTVTVGYYSYTQAVRIILEGRRAMPGTPEKNVYSSVVSPTLVQFGLEIEGGPQNGMSYLFQLSDGSYIVIDGGFYRAYDAEKLMNYMLRHAPDKRNVTIAAWIITHAHGDHTGTFRYFSEQYAKKTGGVFKLEKLIAAFLDEPYRLKNFTDEGSEVPAMLACMNKYADAEYVRAHVGQKYYIRDAEIEILYTIESYMPKALTYFNNSSLVFTLKIAGQKFLFTGDASNETMDIVARMFGSYINSDFVQSAHHGYGGGDKSFYGLIKAYALSSPAVVLWPVGNKDYPGLSRGQLYNTYLVNRLHTVKEIIVAGSRDVILKLPYTPGTSGEPTVLK